MYQDVSFSSFVDAFAAHDRTNFSRAGLRALFDYIEEYEEDTGERVELDVIGLCCDYAEYSGLEEFRDNYGDEFATIEDIEAVTMVIRIPGSDAFIILSF